MFTLYANSSTDSTLPTCYYTWVGDPSAQDFSTYQLDGHDVNGVIKFAKCAKNPVVFNCLESHVDYYKNLFEKQHGLTNIKVQSIESLAKEFNNCKDERLRLKANLICELIEIHKARNSKRDLVIIKNLISLLCNYKGGYALDTNVQPVETKPISLPAFSQPMLPGVNNRFDVWLLYAPAEDERTVKSIINYLDKWIEGEERKTIAHLGLIIGAVKVGYDLAGDAFPFKDISPHYLYTDYQKNSSFVTLKDLPLYKVYNNTHVYPEKRHALICNRIQKKLALEEYKKFDWTEKDYNRVAWHAIKKHYLGPLEYILEEKNHLNEYMYIVKDILQKSSDIHATFKKFLEKEKQQPITEDSDDFESLKNSLFQWSIEVHATDYAKFFKEGFVANTETLGILKNLCNKNIILIAMQLLKEKNWEAFFDIPLTFVHHEELLKEVVNAQQSEMLSQVLQHPTCSLRFIHYVTFGEQHQAEELLKKFNQDEKALFQMLTKKMDMIDIAGKKFKNVTAFQYALWALDRHMWEMLLNYLPGDAAKFQLEELEEKGVSYTKSCFDDEKEENISSERHFDFSPLIDALNDYVENIDTRNLQEQDAAWCKGVGGAQRNVPAHVAKEYCRKDRNFYPVPDFKEARLPHELGFFNYVTNSHSSWFSGSLGSQIGILGYFAGRARGIKPNLPKSDHFSNWLRKRACVDLAAVTALRQVRLKELEILKKSLMCSTSVEVLPTVYYTWAGAPSEQDTNVRRLDGHDVDGVIKFAKCANNPIVFYCLESNIDGSESYINYYRNLFENKHGLKNITVKSIESLVKECYAFEDERIRSNADLISKIIEIHKQRNTKRDLVSIKELVSLVTIYKGGYALDTNVKPTEMKPISLPYYAEFKLPKIVRFDVWLLYAPPKDKRVVEAITKFLEQWTRDEERGDYNYSAIMCAIRWGLAGCEELNMSSPKFASLFLKCISDPVTSLVHVTDLSLSKRYNNSHVLLSQRADVVNYYIKKKQWECLKEYRRISWIQEDYNAIFKGAIDDRNLDTIQYLSEEKNHLEEYVSIAKEILQKTSDGCHSFRKFLEKEEKEPFLSKDPESYQSIIKSLFSWSIEFHAVDYTKLLKEDLIENREILKTLKELCKNNTVPIIKQLLNKKDIAVFFDMPLTFEYYKQSITELVEDRQHEKLSLALQHPLFDNISADIYRSLINSALKNKDKNTLLVLSKYKADISSFIFMMFNEQLENNTVSNFFKKELENHQIEQQQKENSENFDTLVAELLSWSFLFEKTKYTNFLVKQLKSINITYDLLKKACNHGLQFNWENCRFTRPTKYGSPVKPIMRSPYFCHSEDTSTDECKFSPYVQILDPTLSPSTQEETALNIYDRKAPFLDINKSSLFAKRKKNSTRTEGCVPLPLPSI